MPSLHHLSAAPAQPPASSRDHDPLERWWTGRRWLAQLLAPPPPLTGRERLMYRVILLVGAITIVGLGPLFRRFVPGAVDPSWQRFAVGGICLAAMALANKAPQHVVVATLHSTFALSTAWVLNLLRLNAFRGEYALGALLVVSVIAAIFRSPRALAVYAIATLGATAVIAAAVPAPQVSPWLFGFHLLTMLLLCNIAVLNRLHAQRELTSSEARYALAVRGAHDGVWDWDLVADTFYVSSRWRETMGEANDDAPWEPARWLARVDPEDVTHVREALFAEGGSDREHLFEVEYRITHPDGLPRWLHLRGVRVADASGRVVRLAGSQMEISGRKRIEEKLVHDALHDGLTGLANRTLFLDRLEHAIEQLKRHPDRHFAVVYVDLDYFKAVNDRLGHLAADQLLVAFAGRLQRVVRPADTVARLGGDEFALLLPDVGDPAAVVERLQHALADPFDVGPTLIALTASIGVAVSTLGFERPEDALRDADAAMYRAKARGRMRAEIAGVTRSSCT